jgi:probable F420-dependent oxidoreductase
MKFGIALPNCCEGLEYPIPFITFDEVVDAAVQSEQLGYDSVLANDHLTTPRYVRERFDSAPRFYEPLVTLTSCAARTSVIRLMTGVIVVPMRTPVLLAKQVATVDQASHGRIDLGVGVGAYLEEFHAVQPAMAGTPRGELVREGIESLRLLWGERRASYSGKHFQFTDVELFPKPVQTQLPIYSAGNAPASIARAAELGQGWMPAGLSAERLQTGVERLRELATEHGRDPGEIEVAPQVVVSIASTGDKAVDAFERSQVYRHLLSLHESTLKGIDPAIHVAANLIGTPDEISTRVEALRRAGAEHLCGLLFVAESLPQMMESVTLFAKEVIPAFQKEGNRS